MPGASMQASMIFPVWGGEGRRVGRGSISLHTGMDDSSLPQDVSLPQVASRVRGGAGRDTTLPLRPRSSRQLPRQRTVSPLIPRHCVLLLTHVIDIGGLPCAVLWRGGGIDGDIICADEEDDGGWAVLEQQVSDPAQRKWGDKWEKQGGRQERVREWVWGRG